MRLQLQHVCHAILQDIGIIELLFILVQLFVLLVIEVIIQPEPVTILSIFFYLLFY